MVILRLSVTVLMYVVSRQTRLWWGMGSRVTLGWSGGK